MLRMSFVAAMATCLAFASSASAGVLNNGLTHNGFEDRLSTTSPAGLASIIKADGSAWNPSNPSFANGDVIYGFVVAPFGTNDQGTGFQTGVDMAGGFTVGMFAAELSADAGGQGINLVMPTNASLRLANLVDPVFAAEMAGFEDQAMVAVISGGVGTPVLDGINEADNTSGDGLKHFTSADFDLEFLANTADVGSGEGFFQFQTANLGNTVGSQRAGFNVIAGVGSMGGLIFKDVDILSLFSPPPTTQAHIALDTTLVTLTESVTDADIKSRDWQFRTSNDGIRLNTTVPEPSSLAIFGLMGVAGLAVGRRKMKKS